MHVVVVRFGFCTLNTCLKSLLYFLLYEKAHLWQWQKKENLITGFLPDDCAGIQSGGEAPQNTQARMGFVGKREARTCRLCLFPGRSACIPEKFLGKGTIPPSFPGTITEYPSCAGRAEAGRRKRQVLLKVLLSYLVPYEETEHTSLSEVLKIKEGDFF